MRYLKLLGVATIALLSTHIALPELATATVITINFDAVTQWKHIDDFYNGGTDSAGSSGPNYGVSFFDFETANFGDANNFAMNSTNGNYSNISIGFTSLSFDFLALSNSTLKAYDGVNGSGNLIGTSVLTPDASFAHTTVGLSGVGRSFVLTSENPAEAAIDNLVINTVPEPATLALLGIGTVAMAAAKRKEQRCEA